MTDIFLRAGAANPNDAVLYDPTVADPITGTAEATSLKLTAFAAGIEDITGTAAAALVKVTAASSAKETFQGTGAALNLKGTAAGAAKETFTGTAAAVALKATSAVSGKEIFTGLSASVSLKLTIVAPGKESFTGTSTSAELDRIAIQSAGAVEAGTILSESDYVSEFAGIDEAKEYPEFGSFPEVDHSPIGDLFPFVSTEDTEEAPPHIVPIPAYVLAGSPPPVQIISGRARATLEPLTVRAYGRVTDLVDIELRELLREQAIIEAQNEESLLLLLAV